MMSIVHSSQAQDNSMQVTPASGIMLTIDFGNGTVREYNDLAGTTVLEVTSAILDVEVQWFGPFAYIRSIEGLVGAGENGWQYWVNGEYASVAVSHYLLDDNDTITWIYSAPAEQQQDPSLVPGIIIVSATGFGFITIVYVNTLRRIR
jgi:hypothetical protein